MKTRNVCLSLQNAKVEKDLTITNLIHFSFKIYQVNLLLSPSKLKKKKKKKKKNNNNNKLAQIVIRISCWQEKRTEQTTPKQFA